MAVTLMDRSIIVRMRRRLPNEIIERLARTDSTNFDVLMRKCARWSADHIERLRMASPTIPAALNDRAADSWSTLLAIAEAAGGEWPDLARKAARALAGEDADEHTGIMLLSDIRALFEQTGREQLPSSEIVIALCGMEERPWPEWYQGKAVTVRGIARLLKPFGIHPATIRIGSTSKDTLKGYRLDQFKDAFSRYTPPISSVTPSQTNNGAAFREKSSVTDSKIVTDEKPLEPAPNKGCDGVTDENTPSQGRKGALWVTCPACAHNRGPGICARNHYAGIHPRQCADYEERVPGEDDELPAVEGVEGELVSFTAGYWDREKHKQACPLCAGDLPCAEWDRLIEEDKRRQELEDRLREAKDVGSAPEPATTSVVNVRYAPLDSYLYIGREWSGVLHGNRVTLPESFWANPFHIGRDGTRDEVIAKYEAWIRQSPEHRARLPELAGKALGCWCSPQRCHGDVLVRLVAELREPGEEEG
jgi:hypothetical protein